MPFVAVDVLFRDDCDRVARMIVLQGDAEARMYSMYGVRAAGLQGLPRGSLSSFIDMAKYNFIFRECGPRVSAGD